MTVMVGICLYCVIGIILSLMLEIEIESFGQAAFWMASYPFIVVGSIVCYFLDDTRN